MSKSSNAYLLASLLATAAPVAACSSSPFSGSGNTAIGDGSAGDTRTVDSGGAVDSGSSDTGTLDGGGPPADGSSDAASDSSPNGNGCPTGQTACPHGCVDERNDVNNCGSCEHACPTAPSGMTVSCVAGNCQTTVGCPTGQTACPHGCVDLQADNMNCGSCEYACPAGPCAAGTCTCGGMSTRSPTCDTCLRQNCCSQEYACASNSDCAAFIACGDHCFNADAGSTCFDACAAAHPTGAKIFNALDTCVNGSCYSSCQ